MQKKIPRLLLDLIFLVVFNVIFFAVGGFNHSLSVWVSYCFVHFSYFMVLITPVFICKNERNAILGLSLQAVSVTYFLIELIVGIIFILLNQDSFVPSVIVQLIIAAIYMSVLLLNFIANVHTSEKQNIQEQEIAYIKTLSSKVKWLAGKVDDKKASKELEKLYDVLHASPTKTNSVRHSIETKIFEKIIYLEEVVYSRKNAEIISICHEIVSMIEDRNRH